jgi:hypothetical protein
MKSSKISCFETHSLPTLARRYPRGFAFYLGNPISSVPIFLIHFPWIPGFQIHCCFLL